MRSVLLSLFLTFFIGLPLAWAGDTGTSDSTLSITPSASAGTTITAADENDRNNDISTWANAHDHDLSNTTSIGDGTAGNKSLCFDAADSTDVCLRFDDTANLVTVDHPTAGTYNQIATITGTAGLTTGTIVMGDGTGSLRSLTSVAGSDDQTLVWDSASTATPRTLPNCTDASGNHLNYTQSTNSFSCGTSSSYTLQTTIVSFTRTGAAGAGSQAITGVGFQPVTVMFFCEDDAADEGASFGSSDDARAGKTIWKNAATDWDTDTNTAITVRDISAGASNDMEATVASYDSDGFTLTWTEAGTGPDVDCDALAWR